MATITNATQEHSSWRATTVLLIILLPAIVYVPSLYAPLQFDDLRYITNYGPDASFKQIYQSIQPNRPVLSFTFALNNYFAGTDSFSYHVVNVILHVANCLLAYIFLSFLVKSYSSKIEATPQVGSFVPFFATLIFAVHPINTEAVSYVSSRSSLMASFFYLAAMILFCAAIRPGGRKGKSAVMLICSLVSFLLSVGSKEIGATLPFALLLLVLCLHQPCETSNEQGKLSGLRKRLLFLVPYFLMIPAIFFLRTFVLGRMFGGAAGKASRTFGVAEYFFTQLRVIVQYIRLLFFPVGLNVDPDVVTSKSLFETSVLFALAALLVIVVLAILWRRKARTVCFSILWFFILLAPTSSFIRILDPMAERRLYLPSLAFCIILAVIFDRLINPAKMRDLSKRAKGLAGISFALTLVLLAYSTHARNAVWGDTLALWQDAVRKSPDKSRPHLNFGEMLRRHQRYSWSITELRKSLEIIENDIAENRRQAKIYASVGDEYMRRKCLDRASIMRINSALALLHLGSALTSIGEPSQAISSLEEALEIKPNYTAAYRALGVAHYENGEYEKSVASYLKLIDLEPGIGANHADLARSYAALEQFDDAQREYNSALSLAGNSAVIHFGMGNLLVQQEKFAEAEEAFVKTLQLDAEHIGALRNLGNIMLAREDLNRAIFLYITAIERDPTDDALYANLGLAYLRAGDINKAIASYRESIRLQYKNPDAHYNLAAAYFNLPTPDLHLAREHCKIARQQGYAVPEEFWNDLFNDAIGDEY